MKKEIHLNRVLLYLYTCFIHANILQLFCLFQLALLFMEEIRPKQLISLSHYFIGVLYIPRCRIASITSIWGFIAGWLLAGECSGIQANMVRWRQGISCWMPRPWMIFPKIFGDPEMHFGH